jgi:hypothetical protein
MQDFYVTVGDTVTFAKTVGETDIYPGSPEISR